MRWHTDDPVRNAVLADLVELEHQLLDPLVRVEPTKVRRLLHDEFEEVGGSGRHWHRDAIVDHLAGNPGPGCETSQVDAHFVTADTVLITYAARTLDDTHRVSRRSSLWIREGERWSIRYHQGTRVG